jgi:hypothetical protein
MLYRFSCMPALRRRATRQLRLMSLVRLVPMFTLNNDEYEARPEFLPPNFGVTTDGPLHFFPLFASGGSFSERE